MTGKRPRLAWIPVAALLGFLIPQAGAQPGTSGLRDGGVGMYTDPSVAQQLSTFTINPAMVSCGVGTVAGPDWSGPFAMLMYSTRLDSYEIDRMAGTIRASGRMRSITRTGDSTVEDVEHEFIAVATTDSLRSASRGPRQENGTGQAAAGRPRFDVHMRSAFWSTGNPMCAKSSLVEGGCRFGGELMVGEINVSPPSGA